MGGRWFWLGLAVGWTVMAYALWGVFADHDATNPPGLARWVLGGALAHDVLIAPAVLLVGAGSRPMVAPVGTRSASAARSR